MSFQSSVSSDELATVSEIAEFLHVANSWVYERTRRRGIERIPHFKLGKYLRFSKLEVLEWVQRHRGEFACSPMRNPLPLERRRTQAG
jgi:excisionase family DNA binding protein